jgi:capsular polysaccharide biosynthesis protein
MPLFQNKFQVIQMSIMPILEQLYVFSRAKVIVSIHGAALTHILFCNQECKVVEIASNKMASLLHFQHIAETMNVNHTHYLKVYESSPNKYESDLIITQVDDFVNYISS